MGSHSTNSPLLGGGPMVNGVDGYRGCCSVPKDSHELLVTLVDRFGSTQVTEVKFR